MPYSILHLFSFSSSILPYPSRTIAYVMIPRNTSFHIHLYLLLFGLPTTYTTRRTTSFPNDNILCHWWTDEHRYSILPTTLIYYLCHWWTDVLSLIKIHFSRLPVIASFHPDIILSFSFRLHILSSRQSHNGPIASWSCKTIDPPYSLWHQSRHSLIRHPSNVTQLPMLPARHWTLSFYSTPTLLTATPPVTPTVEHFCIQIHRRLPLCHVSRTPRRKWWKPSVSTW